jgi:hypothetical protein
MWNSNTCARPDPWRRFLPLPRLAQCRTGVGGLPGVLTAGLCVATLACIPRLDVKPQILDGRFAGTTENGEPVVVSFREQQESFRGEGTLDGEPLVVAGATGWRGVGALESGGSSELVSLTLSSDGETVVVERIDGPPLVLQRQAGPVPSLPDGPFSGRFRALRGRAPLAEVTLVQSGELLAGVAIFTGDPVGVTGRSQSAREAAGTITFLDGSQAAFQAELAADGASMVVTGFGEPVTLKRRGAQ